MTKRMTSAVPRGLRTRFRAGAAALCAGVLAITACSSDFHLSVVNFSIAPDPAAPGDEVVASFILNLIPAQRHTMVIYIDDEEHLRTTVDGTPEMPVIIPLGDAAALIDEYGVGAHTAYVLVEAGGERGRSDFNQFTLNAQ